MLSPVQSISFIQLFVTPWTVARQAYLSITNSQNLLKLMSIKLVMPSNHLKSSVIPSFYMIVWLDIRASIKCESN